MKIATWNINSVRHRIALVTRFLRDEQPDVLALQETKVTDDLFPAEPIRKLGYVHQALHGQKAYHGVAILSRLPFRETGVQDFCREGHARHMGVTLSNGVALHNFYVPAGGDIPDPGRNAKFAHKLHFLEGMEKFFASRRSKRSDPVILVGDLNVAPLESDVWSHRQLLDVVSHTPVETKLLGEVQSAFEWTDATRHFIPPDEKIYSWWSYRAGDWEASDRGRRLDHVWASPGLKGALRSQKIVKRMRGWQKASDHVPVVVEFDV
ncbi:MAG TPA: exodeoxyribonuclease III [Rhizomicrobium sp.]|jgi:exodeoxyribonuclease-3|nr:exodeoxyribonuclease III [Rhizomicrobium sp.]